MKILRKIFIYIDHLVKLNTSFTTLKMLLKNAFTPKTGVFDLFMMP